MWKARAIVAAVVSFASTAVLTAQIGPGGGDGDPGGGQPGNWDIVTPVQGYGHPHDVDLSTQGTATGAGLAYSVMLRIAGRSGPDALLGMSGGTSTIASQWHALIDCEGGFDVPWHCETECVLELGVGTTLQDTHEIIIRGWTPPF